MTFKHSNGEIHAFNDEYFEPYDIEDDQLEQSSKDEISIKGIVDYTFVETLLKFRKCSRQNNWHMLLYFIKLCFLYIRRAIK